MTEPPTDGTTPLLDNVLVGTFMGGAAGGFVGRLLFHPMDTCKAAVQCHGRVEGRGAWSICATLLKADGFRGLYAGFGIGATGAIPGCCLYFTAFEAFKRHLFGVSNAENTHSPAVDFASGFLAECVSCLVWVPVDVCKERLQTQTTLGVTSYKGSWDALNKIARVEGLTQLYKGYYATLLSFGPLSAFYFTFFECIKRQVCQYRMKRSSGPINEDKKGYSLTPMENLAVAAMAATGAAWLTTPLDLVKMRLQVQRSSKLSITGRATPFRYSGFGRGLQDLLSGEGVRGAFKGASARCFFHTPTFAVSMAVMSAVRGRWLESSE